MFALRVHGHATVLGDILTALTQMPIVVGALVALMVAGGLFLLNTWQDWFMSTKRHRELIDIMQASVDAAKVVSDRAHDDADAKVVTMRKAMDDRSAELRADLATRVAEVRADSQAELDRMLKMIDALQREVEQWRLAFHVTDQANREEDDARWTHIQSALAVLVRLAEELQRQVLHPQPQPRELEAGRDR